MSNQIPTWAILRAAGIPDDQHADVMRRAERIVEHWRPDGAREYVAVTPEWSAWISCGMRPIPQALRNFTVSDEFEPFDA